MIHDATQNDFCLKTLLTFFIIKYAEKIKKVLKT